MFSFLQEYWNSTIGQFNENQSKNQTEEIKATKLEELLMLNFKE